MYCPTHLMKADPLSKLECSGGARSLLLHHVANQDLSMNDFAGFSLFGFLGFSLQP